MSESWYSLQFGRQHIAIGSQYHHVRDASPKASLSRLKKKLAEGIPNLRTSSGYFALFTLRQCVLAYMCFTAISVYRYFLPVDSFSLHKII